MENIDQYEVQNMFLLFEHYYTFLSCLFKSL